MKKVLSTFNDLCEMLIQFCVWIAGIVSGLATRVFLSIKKNKKACWYLSLAGKYLIVILLFVLVFQIGTRVGQKKAFDTYEQWLEDYKIEQEVAALKAIEEDPYTVKLNSEAEMLAKVLYGVKDNKTDDLRTYCWCVFNRVDNKAFPDTLEDVIGQPQQWMRYDVTNPIIESLYQIAREELDKWYTDSHRPVSSDYVFMNWSNSDICLRDNFYEGSGTHYWRYNQ